MLTENNKNIMFNLFDGEAYGYIGSSAIASRMRKDKYPNENVAVSPVNGWMATDLAVWCIAHRTTC